MQRILIVDDEENMAAALDMLFQGEGYGTRTAANGHEALDMIRRGERFDVVLSDMKMPAMGGLELLRILHEEGVDVPFVLLTAYGTIGKAVEAMKLGAVDVVTKPFEKEVLLSLIRRICRMGFLQEENRLLRAAADRDGDAFQYASARMREAVSLLSKAGPVSTPVLLTGESGTGKEIAARMLHALYAGGFDRKPFVSVNCPAVPESLLESELFGYRRGAFTGADRDFQGRVGIADGGTLFLDEIGDLPLPIQPKLLRLLENKTYEPLGTASSRRVDLRIVCATNNDLRFLVRAGRFREDLLYRINAITIAIPALRERPEDIPLLAAAFLKRFSAELRKPVRGFSEEAMGMLVRYPWPGNVRELRNVVERAVVLCAGETATSTDLPAELRELPEDHGTEKPASGNVLVDVERRLLVEALAASNGNISQAARRLGITRNTIRYRMQKYDLHDGRNAP